MVASLSTWITLSSGLVWSRSSHNIEYCNNSEESQQQSDNELYDEKKRDVREVSAPSRHSVSDEISTALG